MEKRVTQKVQTEYGIYFWKVTVPRKVKMPTKQYTITRRAADVVWILVRAG